MESFSQDLLLAVLPNSAATDCSIVPRPDTFFGVGNLVVLGGCVFRVVRSCSFVVVYKKRVVFAQARFGLSRALVLSCVLVAEWFMCSGLSDWKKGQFDGWICALPFQYCFHTCDFSSWSFRLFVR